MSLEALSNSLLNHQKIIESDSSAIRDSKHGESGLGIAGLAAELIQSKNCENGVTEQSVIVPKMELWQKAAITAWIERLGGSPETIAEETAETIAQCENDAEARLYYLKRATSGLGNRWALEQDSRQFRDTTQEALIPVQCGDCLHWKPFNVHGKGSGICAIQINPNGVCHWSETRHLCKDFKLKEKS